MLLLSSATPSAPIDISVVGATSTTAIAQITGSPAEGTVRAEAVDTAFGSRTVTITLAAATGLDLTATFSAEPADNRGAVSPTASASVGTHMLTVVNPGTDLTASRITLAPGIVCTSTVAGATSNGAIATVQFIGTLVPPTAAYISALPVAATTFEARPGLGFEGAAGGTGYTGFNFGRPFRIARASQDGVLVPSQITNGGGIAPLSPTLWVATGGFRVTLGPFAYTHFLDEDGEPRPLLFFRDLIQAVRQHSAGYWVVDPLASDHATLTAPVYAFTSPPTPTWELEEASNGGLVATTAYVVNGGDIEVSCYLVGQPPVTDTLRLVQQGAGYALYGTRTAIALGLDPSAPLATENGGSIFQLSVPTAAVGTTRLIVKPTALIGDNEDTPRVLSIVAKDAWSVNGSWLRFTLVWTKALIETCVPPPQGQQGYDNLVYPSYRGTTPEVYWYQFPNGDKYYPSLRYVTEALQVQTGGFFSDTQQFRTLAQGYTTSPQGANRHALPAVRYTGTLSQALAQASDFIARQTARLGRYVLREEAGRTFLLLGAAEGATSELRTPEITAFPDCWWSMDTLYAGTEVLGPPTPTPSYDAWPVALIKAVEDIINTADYGASFPTFTMLDPNEDDTQWNYSSAIVGFIACLHGLANWVLAVDGPLDCGTDKSTLLTAIFSEIANQLTFLDDPRAWLIAEGMPADLATVWAYATPQPRAAQEGTLDPTTVFPGGVDPVCAAACTDLALMPFSVTLRAAAATIAGVAADTIVLVPPPDRALWSSPMWSPLTGWSYEVVAPSNVWVRHVNPWVELMAARTYFLLLQAGFAVDLTPSLLNPINLVPATLHAADNPHGQGDFWLMEGADRDDLFARIYNGVPWTSEGRNRGCTLLIECPADVSALRYGDRVIVYAGAEPRANEWSFPVVPARVLQSTGGTDNTRASALIDVNGINTVFSNTAGTSTDLGVFSITPLVPARAGDTWRLALSGHVADLSVTTDGVAVAATIDLGVETTHNAVKYTPSGLLHPGDVVSWEMFTLHAASRALTWGQVWMTDGGSPVVFNLTITGDIDTVLLLGHNIPVGTSLTLDFGTPELWVIPPALQSSPAQVTPLWLDASVSGSGTLTIHTTAAFFITQLWLGRRADMVQGRTVTSWMPTIVSAPGTEIRYAASITWSILQVETYLGIQQAIRKGLPGTVVCFPYGVATTYGLYGNAECRGFTPGFDTDIDQDGTNVLDIVLRIEEQ